MKIRARAPLRLGLGGGGTDVAPYCDQFGGFVLNTTIDRYAYATLSSQQDKIVFSATDHNIHETYSIDKPLPDTIALKLHHAVYQHFILNYNGGNLIPLQISTFCDAPVGSGLGTSSTLVVAMVKAFSEWFNAPLDDYDIAKLAFKIEREDCGLAGGRQDQYSATFGGVNFIEFYEDQKTIVNPLRIKNWILCELEASLLLYFTGVSRESAKVISDQSKNVHTGSLSTLDAMHGIKREAVIMKESILKGDFTQFVDSMREGWENKKRTSSAVSNSLIDEIYHDVIHAGALAGKVSGAGGGGFMLFFVPIEKRMQVIETLNKFPGYVSNAHFTKLGCQAWRL